MRSTFLTRRSSKILVKHKILLFEFLKLFRFGIAGVMNSLLYGLFSLTLTNLGDYSAIAIHAIAFSMCVPISYFLQRDFTFRHSGAHRQSAIRFLALMTVLFLVGLFTVEVANWLDLTRYAGIAMVILIIPLTSFFAMRFWIFR
ncbi:MAG: GtrA family protein [Hyphomicrobiales bacterium]